MRFHFLLCAFILSIASSSARANTPVGNKNYYLMIFPKDINKFPILFEKFRPASQADKAPLKAMGHDCLIKDLEPKEVNALIQYFIDSHPEFEHKMVPPKEIDSIPVSAYKYVVKTKLMQFESISSDNVAVSTYRVFKSVFYFTDRTTGKEYTAFYNPKQKSMSLSNRHLPAYPPKDKKFFKVLSSYIAELNGE